MASGRRRTTVRKLSNLSIDEVSLVDRGANQHASVEIAKRFFSEGQREKLADKGQAEPDGSFPIKSKQDARNAERLIGHASGKKRADVERRIEEELGKRAPEAADYFTDEGEISKLSLPTVERAAEVGAKVGEKIGRPIGHVGRAMKPAIRATESAGESLRRAGNTATARGHSYGEGLWHAGNAVAGAAPVAVPVAAATAGTAGAVAIHHHYAGSHFHKSAEGDVTAPQADDYFSKADQTASTTTRSSAGKHKGSSFGRGGNTAGTDEINESSDPTGIRDDVEATGDDHAGGSAPTTQGETVPAGNGKKSKVGKSANFWSNFVSKVLGDEEFTTEGDTDDTLLEKHFPGAPNQPFGGGQPGPSMGQPPVMQSVGAQPYGMGMPQPPMGGQPQMGGQAQSGLGALPPEAVQYIQQLEQRISELEGEGDGGTGEQDSSSGSQDSSDGRNGDKKNPFGKRADQMDTSLFLSELAKSLDDEDQRVAVEKALYEVNIAKSRAEEAERVAKAERDLRLEREFVAKAAEFAGLPVAAKDLGPVLKRAAESLEREDFDTIVKCLRAASDSREPWFAEVGKRGGGSNGSILDEVEAAAAEIEKSAGGLSHEQAAAQVLEMNPRMYEQYLAERSGR